MLFKDRVEVAFERVPPCYNFSMWLSAARPSDARASFWDWVSDVALQTGRAGGGVVPP